MSQSDLFAQFKNMDAKERENLLNQVMSALSPEQKKMVNQVIGDPKAMEKVQKNLKTEDLSALMKGLSGGGDPQDFLQSPRIQKKMKDLLR